MQSDENFTNKVANSTITILLARAMAIFGPVAAGYIFVNLIGGLEANVKLVQSDVRRVEKLVSDVAKDTAINSVNIVVHEKQITDLGTRVTYIERGR